MQRPLDSWKDPTTPRGQKTCTSYHQKKGEREREQLIILKLDRPFLIFLKNIPTTPSIRCKCR